MLRDVLPSTVQDFCKLGESLGNTVRLTELPTMMGLNRVTNEIAPMIFIGGLQNDPVEVFQPVARNLLYPVFCLHIPNIKMSLQKMVTFILPVSFDILHNLSKSPNLIMFIIAENLRIKEGK